MLKPASPAGPRLHAPLTWLPGRLREQVSQVVQAGVAFKSAQHKTFHLPRQGAHQEPLTGRRSQVAPAPRRIKPEAGDRACVNRSRFPSPARSSTFARAMPGRWPQSLGLPGNQRVYSDASQPSSPLVPSWSPQ